VGKQSCLDQLREPIDKTILDNATLNFKNKFSGLLLSAINFSSANTQSVAVDTAKNKGIKI
jgi:hypothetical protein